MPHHPRKRSLGEGDFDFGNAVIQSSDGDFVITGYTSPDYLLLIKTDSNGNKIWRKKMDGREGFDIKECDDGSYIIAGRERICLIKTDKDGNMFWKRDYQGKSFDRALSVDITNEGG